MRASIVFGLFSLGSGIPYNLLTAAGVRIEILKGELGQAQCKEEEPFIWKRVVVGKSVATALDLAKENAEKFHHTHIGTDHLLLALLEETEGPAAAFFEKYMDRNATKAKLMAELA